MQFIALDHLNGGFQALLYTIGERLPGVAAIDQHAFNSLQIRPAAADNLQDSATIGRLGCGNRDNMGQPPRIHPDAPLDAGDLLAGVVAARSPLPVVLADCEKLSAGFRCGESGFVEFGTSA
jgi:hypothetical protein